eukprot:c4159_g2_i1 orf=2-325(+)
MMLQVEHNLLSKAAMEIIPISSQNPKISSHFTGAREDSTRSKKYARKLKNELKRVILNIEKKKKDNNFDEDAIDLTRPKEQETKNKTRICKCVLMLEHILKTLMMLV